jgi:AbrB family looped-hinge helix DNA binding protein
MSFETRISTKGQIVLPKAVRDRHGWPHGQIMEVVDMPGGVMLRAKLSQDDAKLTGQILERMRRRAKAYNGPPLDDEAIKAAVDATLNEKWSKRLNEVR